jgi:hypothetical protein
MVASTGWAVAAAATNLTGVTRSLSDSSCLTRVSSCSIRWSICCSMALSTATVLPLSCPRITGLLHRRASPRRNTRALVFAQFCLPVRGPVRGSTADDLMTTSSGAGIASCRPRRSLSTSGHHGRNETLQVHRYTCSMRADQLNQFLSFPKGHHLCHGCPSNQQTICVQPTAAFGILQSRALKQSSD